MKFFVVFESESGLSKAECEFPAEEVTVDKLLSALPFLPNEPVAGFLRQVHKNAAWLRCLDDDMLRAMTCSYFNQDFPLDVLLRPGLEAESPNTTPALSRETTGLSHAAIDIAANLDKLRVAEPENDADPFTLTPVSELGEDGIVLADERHCLRVDVESLIQYVKIQVNRGVAVSRIRLAAVASGGRQVEVVLTTDVWVRCLLRGHPKSGKIIGIFLDMVTARSEHQASVRSLHEHTDLFYRVKIYLHDLLNFRNDDDARARLEHPSGASAYFLSDAYFSEEERRKLLDFPSSSGLTFQQCVEASMSEKVAAAAAGRSVDYQVCSSHDLAPIVRDVFSIQKGFQEEKGFKDAQKKFAKLWCKQKR